MKYSRFIYPYCGEFLTSIFPLEVSLNSCSHRCCYCFALNKDNNKVVNVNSLFNYFINYRKKNDLMSHLLKQGHAVVFSNRTDPFSNSNYKISLGLLELMNKQGIPVFFQTKGGKGIDEVLKYQKPSYWYVTITTNNDKLLPRIEPNAPNFNFRIELIKKLIAKGHRVIVGLNPLVNEWWGNQLHDTIDKLIDIGVNNFWLELLHFNSKTKHTKSVVENIPSNIIARASKRIIPIPDIEFIRATENYIESKGSNVFSVNKSKPTKFWNEVKELYPIHFPVNSDLIDYIYKNKRQGDAFTFKEYSDFFIPKLPKGEFELRDYFAINNIFFTTRNNIRKMTYKQLLNLFWNRPELKFPLLRLCFDFMYTDTDDIIFDNDNNILYKIDFT